MSVNGEAGGDALRIGLPIVDMVTGLNAMAGILLALHERQVSGRGQSVDIALYDCGISCCTRTCRTTSLPDVRPGVAATPIRTSRPTTATAPVPSRSSSPSATTASSPACASTWEPMNCRGPALRRQRQALGQPRGAEARPGGLPGGPRRSRAGRAADPSRRALRSDRHGGSGGGTPAHPPSRDGRRTRGLSRHRLAGEAFAHPGQLPRHAAGTGRRHPEVLAELGLSAEAIDALVRRGIVRV